MVLITFKSRKALLAHILTSLLFMTGLLNSADAAQEKFKVVTTFTIIQDMAKNVAGDAAIVESITKAGAEIHEYEPTPQDIVKVQSANLVLWNGLNLELWFKRFFEDINDVPSVVVTDGIKTMPIQEGSYKGNPNPHAWMSPTLALIYVDNIRAALVKYDPKNAQIYNQNAANYAAKIKAIDIPLRERIAKIPQSERWLVTSEGAFSYLTRDYNMHEAYLWPINAESQGTPKQVKHIIDLVREKHIPVIFSESTISNKPALQVSEETDIKYGGVLYVDSLSKADGPVPTYLDLLKTTVETIAEGFDK